MRGREQDPGDGWDGWRRSQKGVAHRCYIESGQTPRGAQAIPFPEVRVRVGLLLGLAVLLAIVWVVSFIVFHVAGLLIHLLLILAVVFLILQLFTGKKL